LVAEIADRMTWQDKKGNGKLEKIV
jgi:hypothetical protein